MHHSCLNGFIMNSKINMFDLAESPEAADCVPNAVFLWDFNTLFNICITSSVKLHVRSQGFFRRRLGSIVKDSNMSQFSCLNNTTGQMTTNNA